MPLFFFSRGERVDRVEERGIVGVLSLSARMDFYLFPDSLFFCRVTEGETVMGLFVSDMRLMPFGHGAFSFGHGAFPL